jgi:HlyD family secretion protein
VVTYTAVVEVSNPDLKLRPGMTATARIVTGEKPDVLKIPNAALRFRPPPNFVIQAQTNAVAAVSTNRAAGAVVATDESGVPIPPWRAERRRPTQEEREKFEASLTPDQKQKYQQAMEQMRRRFTEGGGGAGFGGRGGGGGDTPRSRPEGPITATVYLLDKAAEVDGTGKPIQMAKAVTVKTGLTDGSSTEVIEGLKEGDAVITGLVTQTTIAGPAQPQSNPFAPSFGRGGQRGGQQQRR